MRVLGIDPGTTRIGYGVVVSMGSTQEAGAYGCFLLKDIAPEERLGALYDKLVELIKKEKPDVVATEKVFFSKNKKTAMAIGEARGIIKLVAQQNNLPLYEYTPTEIKSAISTHGGASKKEVQKMVTLLLQLKETPEPDDTADALAIALCCAARRDFAKNIVPPS